MISHPYFWDEQAAHTKLEEIVWPNGPVCTHCGATDRIGAVTGKGARAGLKFCCRCRKQFRATIGTMFEGSHVPLHKWFQACFLLSSPGYVISAHQLHLRLEVTNKTALGIVHRLARLIEIGRSGEADARTGSTPRSPAAGGWQRPLRRLHRASDTIGWDELPWMQFPTQPKRQFLRFLETVRKLGCAEDEDRFDGLLTMIVTNSVSQRRGRLKDPPGAPMELGFTRHTRSDLEYATA
jgi:hypothetical protein